MFNCLIVRERQPQLEESAPFLLKWLSESALDLVVEVVCIAYNDISYESEGR